VNNERRQGNACISHDELALFFNEDDSLLMKMSVRRTRDSDWGPAVDISATLCPEHQKRYGPELSPDGRALYFHHHDWGAFTERKFWQAPITPIVDFNGDGEVDGSEVSIMADRWGTDDRVCDIGPMPWGDGIVDVEDLKVIAEYIGQEVTDPTFVAHWPLDETEGTIAHDSAGDRDATTVIGTPVWRLGEGAVDGALELDGTTFLTADSVLNPTDGAFSVFAWVKGGAPGQVIVSQAAGSNWLMADVATGALMTELESGDRNSEPLCSDAVITDGNWHRVGFVWDGSARRLYVDGILVAEDTDIALAACDGGLNIGCGKLMTPTSFFVGLLDDVRIYNRVVRP
jgi:hypothetical protein